MFEVVDELVTQRRVVDVGEVRDHQHADEREGSDDRRRAVPRAAHGVRGAAHPQRHRTVREHRVDGTRQHQQRCGDGDHHDVLHHVPGERFGAERLHRRRRRRQQCDHTADPAPQPADGRVRRRAARQPATAVQHRQGDGDGDHADVLGGAGVGEHRSIRHESRSWTRRNTCDMMMPIPPMLIHEPSEIPAASAVIADRQGERSQARRRIHADRAERVGGGGVGEVLGPGAVVATPVPRPPRHQAAETGRDQQDARPDRVVGDRRIQRADHEIEDHDAGPEPGFDPHT